MIASIRGILTSISPLNAVVECAGVGYSLNIPLTTSEKISSQKGQEVFLIARSVYREDAALLYGFYDSMEAEIFDFLRSLPGIGPSLSLNLISHLGAGSLTNALLQAESSSLTNVPGVGKVKAEKILFEARSREKKLRRILSEESSSSTLQLNDLLDSTLEEALINLGYHKKEIEKASVKISSSGEQLPPLSAETLQDHLRMYLRFL